ncbi:hypothetical protein BJY01DRAFT_247286 [Aspergillus pseudoustus]|uniref:Heterokaryon incompatibility domain-containing protein n=1 Tax=Aspergillus pseudoustus TaxID=1810923 RepID=A0ABR4K235_9EURO
MVDNAVMEKCLATLAAFDEELEDPRPTIVPAAYRADIWLKVEKYWPRRLLHIPTMKSIERKGTSTYNGIQEPNYGILSYTWGRWESNDFDPIQIHGTSWKIPAVEPEHFTPTMLQAVINEIGRSVDHLWLDIACIDQDDEATKMDEVGRQVGIFAQAHRMYVWLTYLDPVALHTTLNDFVDCVSYLLFIELDEDPRPTIKYVARCLTMLLKDPWFSSLWTLQECTINRKAMILSRDGKPVPARSVDGNFLLTMLANETCAMIYYLGRLAEEAPHMIQGVEQEIETIRLHAKLAGFGNVYISNPNVQYELVRYRTTTRLEDRIYGITQIYNLRLGQTLEPSKTFTLNDLKEQFAEALVTHYPTLSQMFIHTGQPQPGLTWRLTEECEVPWMLHSAPATPPLCSLTLTEEKALHCVGTCCGPCDLDRNLVTQPSVEIYLDRHIEQGLSLAPRPLLPLLQIKREGNAGTAAASLDKVCLAFGEKNVIIVPLVDDHPLTCLLLLRKHHPTRWERLGLITWLLDNPDELLGHCVPFEGNIF